jgi:Rieske 2Fe-2S family protein
MGEATVSTAPLDLDQVRACLVGSGTMLPGPAYTDEAVLAWERRVVFAGGWACVGRADDLAEPGSRRAVSVGDDAVLLVRGDDGLLRGFYNVCRHRGHEIMPCGTTARSRFVTCPYHSWVYELDGGLHKVPSAHRAGVDNASIGLVPVAVTEWHGFVFVNADGTAAPFDVYGRGLDALVAPYGCARLAVAATHEYDLAAN